MERNLFISLDGVDGAGKSTQIPLLCDWLRQRGHTVISCRDPGSTPLGDNVRSLLLNRQDVPISPTAEMLLYMAARAQLVDEVIRPALAAGKTVVSDRFLLANVVYQGHAGGLDVDSLWQVGQTATGGLRPDLTLVLDLSPEEAKTRMARPLDRIELRGEEFQRRVRAGFLAEAQRAPGRIVVVSAAGSPDEVQQALREHLLRHWSKTESPTQGTP